MPLTVENSGAALIAGRPLQTEHSMKTKKVTVIRAFYFNREIQALGRVVELPSVFADEMIAAKKAEPCYEQPPAVPPTASKPEVVTGKRNKERTDAGE